MYINRVQSFFKLKSSISNDHTTKSEHNDQSLMSYSSKINFCT